MTMKTPRRAICRLVAIAFLIAHGTLAHAVELVVFSGGLARSAVSELGPLFERTTAQKLAMRFANNPVLDELIREGTPFDVLIIETQFIEGLVANGYIAPSSRVDLARVGMALGARAGAPRPDMSTVEAFIRVLKVADSIAYTADGHSGAVFIRTLEQLGIFDIIKPKLRPAVGRTASSLVLAGEAQIWAGPISTPARGTEIIGRFPAEVQTYLGVSAAVSTNSSHLNVARSFIAFLKSPEAAAVFAAKGFQEVPQTPSSAVLSELAPTGKLRVGIHHANQFLVSKNPGDGELRGVAIDLARELSRRLGVPLEFVAYANASRLARAAASGEWDVAFLSAERSGAADISFSTAFAEIDCTYLVPAGSALKTVADVDRAGIRIAVAANSALDQFLTRVLKNAELVRTQGFDEAAGVLVSKKLDALAGLRPRLLKDAETLPGSRVLDGRYAAFPQAIGVPKVRESAARYVHDFLEEAKISGIVAASIAKTGMRGVTLAPPASAQ